MRYPNTKKVVKVSKVEDTQESLETETPDQDAPKFSRGPIVKFEVRLNSKVVEGKDGAGILAETIRQIGYERVAALNIMFVKGSYNLVDKRKRTDQNKLWQRQSGDWYIYTNTSNPTKAENLAEIAERLNLDLEITLEGKKFYPRD